MTEAVELDRYRPHLRLSGKDGREYVFPVALAQNIASGFTPVSALEDAVWRTVMQEWLANIRREQS